MAITFKLNNGIEMPALGFGVFQIREGAEVENAVSLALEIGYRSIDTAAIYGNETGTGKAIRESGIARKEIFLTTKVWNSDQGYSSTKDAFSRSLDKLKTDYADLYLVHWPVKGKYKETWRAIEELYSEGLIKAVGVSNFHIHHLEDLMKSAEIKPMVNQYEFHPFLQQKPLLEFCKSNGIIPEAWAPLTQGNRLNDEVLKSVAGKHGKSTAGILLRWDIQKGVVAIPKSTKPERIKENFNIFDFSLDVEDMNKIEKLDINLRFGPDPENFNF